jgi:hypothetical protein
MVSVFVVRAQNDGEPESYLCGVYPTEELALTRCKIVELEEFEYAWYDEVKVGPNGADCLFSNR